MKSKSISARFVFKLNDNLNIEQNNGLLSVVCERRGKVSIQCFFQSR